MRSSRSSPAQQSKFVKECSCHPLRISGVDVRLDPEPATRRVRVEATVRAIARTGVEMEALAGAAIGLLTIYDMCKAVDRGMRIEGVRLAEKRGGRSGRFVA